MMPRAQQKAPPARNTERGADRAEHDISQHILPTSATMVGVCITVISIVRVMEIHGAVTSIIDDIVALDSAMFLVATILSYVSLRSPQSGGRVERFADLVFLAGLAVMVLASFLLAWQLGQSSLVAQ